MKSKLKIYLIILFSVISLDTLNAQESPDSLRQRLELLIPQIPALEKTVDVTVSVSTIQEFLRGIANNTGLNINVDPAMNITVTNNFTNVRVLDVLLFLAREYKLSINITGNIFSITKPDMPIQLKEIGKIIYNKPNDNITLDFQNQALPLVVKEITINTGKNLVISPGLETRKVTAYIQQMPFAAAIDKFAYANDMLLSLTADSFYVLKANEKKDPLPNTQFNQVSTGPQPKNSRNRQGSGKGEPGKYILEVKKIRFDSLSIIATDAPIIDVIREVSENLGINFFVDPRMDATVTVNMSTRNFEDFLNLVLAGTEYSWRNQNGIYIVGNIKSKDVQSYAVIQFQNRTIDKILEFLPADLTEGLQIKEFPEMNSLLVVGATPRLDRLRLFFSQIDKIVPVILIEVLIVDYKSTYDITTGIDAGLGTPAQKTTGKIFPAVDVQLSTQSINNLINSLNGFGVVKLGNVTPNFYLSLKAMETQGIAKIRSTPKLSTLNGHKATLSIGKTEYYLEQRTDIIGSQNPQTVSSDTYKPLNADLKITIRPIVSGDDQITLEIEVEQSDFGDRISPFAPPSQETKKFVSMIRVRNQDMVLLGGLESKRIDDSSTGTPLLSRIPILKWFFSSRTRKDSKAKLNIFIQPTIIN